MECNCCVSQAIPGGVVYEGCYADEPMEFLGTSAAQSSVIQVFDAVLGVHHEETEGSAYLREVQGYMPRGHRELLQHLRVRQQTACIRSYLATAADDDDDDDESGSSVSCSSGQAAAAAFERCRESLRSNLLVCRSLT
eukprot:COSAG06_NODE_657_length_13324_cov_11.730380_6_plen_138_part_00